MIEYICDLTPFSTCGEDTVCTSSYKIIANPIPNFIKDSPIASSFGDEHQLSWCYNHGTIVWSCSNTVRRKIHVKNGIINQIEWIELPLNHQDDLQINNNNNSNNSNNNDNRNNNNNNNKDREQFQYYDNNRYLSVLTSTSLSIHNNASKSFDIVLPCAIKRIWATPIGMVLERKITTKGMQPNPDKPSLFSVIHPLEEVKPILLKEKPTNLINNNNNNNNSNNSYSFFHDFNQSVVYSDNILNLIIMYKVDTNEYIFYRLIRKYPAPKSIELLLPITKEESQQKLDDTVEKSFIDQNEEFILESDIILEVIDTVKGLKRNETSGYNAITTTTSSETGVFLTLDDSKSPTICIKSLDTLYCFKLGINNTTGTIESITPSFQIPSIQSCNSITINQFYNQNNQPLIHNTTNHKIPTNIVTIDKDNWVNIYWGKYLISKQRMNEKEGFNTIRGEITIRDTVFNRITIGDQLKQKRFKIRSITNTLVLDCLNSAMNFIDKSIISFIYQSMIEYKVTNSSTQPTEEFNIFTKLILDIIDKRDSSNNQNNDNLEQENNNTISDWEYLLASDYHKQYNMTNKLLTQSTQPTKQQHINNQYNFKMDTSNVDFKSIDLNQLLLSFHYQYEEYKINTYNSPLLKSLSTLLIQIAIKIKNQNYILYYLKDFGELLTFIQQEKIEPKSLVLDQSQPPSIYQYISTILNSNSKLMSTNEIINATYIKRYRWLNIIYEIYNIINVSYSLSIESLSEQIVIKLVELGVTMELLNSISFGIAVPIREAIWTCRSNPPADWPSSAYILIGRQDLVYHNNITQKNYNSSKKQYHSRYNQQNNSSNNNNNYLSPNILNNTSLSISFIDQQGMSFDSLFQRTRSIENYIQHPISTSLEVCNLRFDRDLRVREVCKLLDYNCKIMLNYPQETGVSDHDYLQELRNHLFMTCQRTLALPVGSAMLTIGSKVAAPAETVEITPIELNGGVVGSKIGVTLEPGVLPADNLHWPQFHSGVAAGLAIAIGNSSTVEVDSASSSINTWIVYNKPQEGPSHAGLLLALGMQKRLSSLAFTKVFEYLSYGHPFTNVGLLLGIACSKRGTMEMPIAKVLSVHIPSLHPPSSIDLDVPSYVQTAAVLGIGLLYQETCNRRMSEVLLAEINRPPSMNDKNLDRDAYSLAAGLALGMVNLGKGGSKEISNFDLEDRLKIYMGASVMVQNNTTNSLFSNSRDQGNGRNGTGIGGTNNNNSQLNQNSNPKSNLVYEGNKPNLEITSPGAILALTLIYLKTNNLKVANYLHIPNELHGLQFIRSDFLLLRVLGKSLILWNSIQPTLKWIEMQIPNTIKNVIKLNEYSEKIFEVQHNTIDDIELFMLAYIHIIAGSCMAIGLKYAGSGDQKAFKLLYTMTEMFEKRQQWLYRLSHRKKPTTPPTSNDDQIMNDKPMRVATETCLNVIALSMSLVMAGTGDIDALGLLRSIRSRVGKEVTYGNHMAIGMAIGFLVLGGQYTLSNSNVAIAALITSLYHRFPNSSSDNHYHLQAFRHLYYLAVESRCLVTRDVDTHVPCHIPIELDIEDEEEDVYQPNHHHFPTMRTISLVTPCIIPQFNKIRSIRVNSPRYWNLRFDLSIYTSQKQNGLCDYYSDGMLTSTPTIYVKRKIGHLSYHEDPEGFKSLSKQFTNQLQQQPPRDEQESSTLTNLKSTNSKEEILKSFSADADILSFTKYFCSTTLDGSGDDNECGYDNTQILFECLTHDKPEMLTIYHHLNQIINNIGYHSMSSVTMKNIRLILQHYKRLDRVYTSNNHNIHRSTRLFESSYLCKLESKIDNYYRTRSINNSTTTTTTTNSTLKDLVHQIILNPTQLLQNNTDGQQPLVSSYLSFYDLPLQIQPAKSLSIPLLYKRMNGKLDYKAISQLV